MDGVEIDHYEVLGLPSGEEGAKLTKEEINKGYKSKALELHPDKRPDDPNAHENFQKLQSSRNILQDDKARKLFDDLLRVKLEQQRRRGQSDAKRQKMIYDLERRERDAFATDTETSGRQEEARIARKLKEEIARIRAMHANKKTPTATFVPLKKDNAGNSKGGDTLDKGAMLKVSWEKGGSGYTSDSLREVFSKFGTVEEVILKESKRRGSALIVMASREAAIAATGFVCGDLSNPLLVLPLLPHIPNSSPNFEKTVEPDNLNKHVGDSFKKHEDSVIEKLLKAAAKTKENDKTELKHLTLPSTIGL